MKCKECAYENRPDRKFCSSCGSELKLICPSCKRENEIGDKFCGECGDRLTNDNELVDDSVKSTDSSSTVDSKLTEVDKSFFIKLKTLFEECPGKDDVELVIGEKVIPVPNKVNWEGCLKGKVNEAMDELR